MRFDFCEVGQWYDGTRWGDMTPGNGALWHFNGTSVLPGGIKGNPNNHGDGIPADRIPNNRPVANAGQNQTVAKGAQVQLDGTASADGDNDVFTYNWSQDPDDAQQVTLPAAESHSPTPTFTAPGVATVLHFRLSVWDVTWGLHHHKPSPGDPRAFPRSSPSLSSSAGRLFCWHAGSELLPRKMLTQKCTHGLTSCVLPPKTIGVNHD